MNQPAALWLDNIRLPDGTLSGLGIASGRITAIGTPPSNAVRENAGGMLCLPALIEGHCHLDKVLLGSPWYAPDGGRSVKDRIAAEKAYRRTLAVPVSVRGARLIEREIAYGTGYLRSHVDIDADWRLDNLEAVLALRERYREWIDIEIVAFPQSGILASPGTKDLLASALQAGADLVGGLDPSYIDADPVEHLNIVFGLAERFGRGIDIHLHEGGPLGLFALELIAERTTTLGLAGRVTVSHAYCLADLAARDLARAADMLAAAGVAILTSAPPHGMPPLSALLAAGVTVFAGSDNIRDCWSPFGNGDPLDRASIAARQTGWSTDAELGAALGLVTTSAARALGLTDYGLTVGSPADFVLVDAPSLAEAVALPSAQRRVFKRGRPALADL